MLMEERFAAILKILVEKPAVTVAELTGLLDTSESTIRRDLAALHNMGKLHKVHGGATAIDADYAAKDDDVASRQELHADEKKRIGRFAASLILCTSTRAPQPRRCSRLSPKNAPYL